MTQEKQMSDSLMVGLLLAFAGGMLDAYSFVNRGAVFATAETGNIVQLCVHLSMGRWSMAFHYLLPIMAFFFGILTAEAIRRHVSGHPNWFHWRQFLVAAECGVLVLVSFLPQGEPDWAANVLISFTSAVQLETFRKFRGCAGATTSALRGKRVCRASSTVAAVRDFCICSRMAAITVRVSCR